jgi:uncharacterized coiled-coil protein SlyX
MPHDTSSPPPEPNDRGDHPRSSEAGTPCDARKTHHELPDRVERVEDRSAFTERTVEQLNDELIAAFRTIERLARRIAQVEERLASFEREAARSDAITPNADPIETLDPPPHSASADERRAIERLRDDDERLSE